MNQRELANKIKCNQMSISNYERGKRVPDALMLMAIAQVLGQELEYFKV